PANAVPPAAAAAGAPAAPESALDAAEPSVALIGTAREVVATPPADARSAPDASRRSSRSENRRNPWSASAGDPDDAVAGAEASGPPAPAAPWARVGAARRGADSPGD